MSRKESIKAREMILAAIDGSSYVDGKIKPGVRALSNWIAELEGALVDEMAKSDKHDSESDIVTDLARGRDPVTCSSDLRWLSCSLCGARHSGPQAEFRHLDGCPYWRAVEARK